MGRTSRIGLTAMVVAAVAAVLAVAAPSAFSHSPRSGEEGFASGSVLLSDADGGRPLLSLGAAGPGGSAAGCIVVSYDGTLPPAVRLYGTTGGDGLARFLALTVTRGTMEAAPDGSCRGFRPDAIDYAGEGAGVLFRGALDQFPDGFGSGIPDPGSAQEWLEAGSHAYRLVVTLAEDPAAAGLSAVQDFVWEAREA